MIYLNYYFTEYLLKRIYHVQGGFFTVDIYSLLLINLNDLKCLILSLSDTHFANKF